MYFFHDGRLAAEMPGALETLVKKVIESVKIGIKIVEPVIQ
jgi:hypothetical protein